MNNIELNGVNNNLRLLVRRITSTARIPSYGSKYAAGLDVCADEDKVIGPNETVLVKTGIAIQWRGLHENEYYMRIAPRSGLALKKGIFINAGVIDYDYTGEVGVVIYNSGVEEFAVKRGDRIAQMILEKIKRVDIEEIDTFENTERGSGGFGSTGL